MSSSLKKRTQSCSSSDLDEEIAKLESECNSLLKSHKEKKREKKEAEKSNRNSMGVQQPHKDKEGNAVFELSAKKKVRISKFKG